MLNAADSYLALIEIYYHAVAPAPFTKLASGFKVVHVGEMQDPHCFPRTLDAAAGYDFRCQRCQSVVKPSRFSSYGEPQSATRSV